jgi:hypothetical protein
LYLGRGSLATFLSGELSMQSGLSSSDTSVSATLSASLGGEDASITYAQSMFSGMSIFKQASYTNGPFSVDGPDDFSYAEGTVGHKLHVYAVSDTSTVKIDLWDAEKSKLVAGVDAWNLEDVYGYPTAEWMTSLDYNVDGLSIGVHNYDIGAFDNAGRWYDYQVTVTVVESDATAGIAIDSLNITMNWDTVMNRVQENTFSLTYSIYVEASPTGVAGAEDYVLEKLITDATINKTGRISFVLYCGTDICKLENMYNDEWNIRIRIVLEGSILDDLGQQMESEQELPAAKILVVWDAEFSVTGSWE